MSILQKIEDIESEVTNFLYQLLTSEQMARTQKNKATSYHLGQLKAKLAKLRRELITPKGGGGPAGEGLYLSHIYPLSCVLIACVGLIKQASTWPRREMP